MWSVQKGYLIPMRKISAKSNNAYLYYGAKLVCDQKRARVRATYDVEVPKAPISILMSFSIHLLNCSSLYCWTSLEVPNKHRSYIHRSIFSLHFLFSSLAKWGITLLDMVFARDHNYFLGWNCVFSVVLCIELFHWTYLLHQTIEFCISRTSPGTL